MLYALRVFIKTGAESFAPAKFGYKDDDIVMLTDDAQNPRQLPTRDNIVCSPFFPPCTIKMFD
jgi:hypothetical protein